MSMEAKRRRVMVVNNQAHLSAGIINLLAANPGLSVETDSPQDAAGLQAIRISRPDVILVYASTPLNGLPVILVSLDDLPVIRAVLVSPDSNCVVVR